MPGVMELVNRAKEEVENLSPSAVARELGRGDVVIVDIREPHETRQGMIPGAIRAPRFPGPSAVATCSAAKAIAPLDIPTNSPSSRASRRATGKASSSHPGMTRKEGDFSLK